MFRPHCTLSAILSTAVMAFAGCGASTTSPTPGTGSAESSPYRLAAEPAGAQDVKAAKEAAKDGDEITLVGRIGGDTNPWVEDQAAFLIVDRGLKPCNEKGDDGCATPWDYCCDSDVLPANKAMVKVVDAGGQTVATDARTLLRLKELQTVVVHGRAKRDEAGNLTVLADGVFIRN